MKLKRAIICDIDGTLANLGDRSPYDFANVDRDELKHATAETVRAMLLKALVQQIDQFHRNTAKMWKPTRRRSPSRFFTLLGELTSPRERWRAILGHIGRQRHHKMSRRRANGELLSV